LFSSLFFQLAYGLFRETVRESRLILMSSAEKKN